MAASKPRKATSNPLNYVAPHSKAISAPVIEAMTRAELAGSYSLFTARIEAGRVISSYFNRNFPYDDMPTTAKLFVSHFVDSLLEKPENKLSREEILELIITAIRAPEEVEPVVAKPAAKVRKK